MKSKAISIAHIESKIYLVQGHKVMLDSDLAELYGVETRVLTQAVKRNRERFPEDFMFQLTKEEYESLRSQIVTSNRKPFRLFISCLLLLIAAIVGRNALCFRLFIF